jgi:hypothetical protein
MNNKTEKVINLEDYIRARRTLKANDASAILAFIEKELPIMEQEVVDIIFEKHKLKKIEPWQDKALRFELALSRVSRFLEQKSSETSDISQKEAQQKLAKQCASLMSWNKDLKAMVADDAKRCSEYEDKNSIDLMRVAGFLLVTPVGVQKFVETLITSKPQVLIFASQAGVVLGGYLAFPKHINAMVARAAKKAVELSTRLHIVRSARNTAAAITISISVEKMPFGNITPRDPGNIAQRSKTVFVAKM